MPALQSKPQLLWFLCIFNTVIWDARAEIGLWQWGKAGYCYNPTQGVRKWPAAHVWKVIGALQKNIYLVKCDLCEETMPKPQDASNKERIVSLLVTHPSYISISESVMLVVRTQEIRKEARGHVSYSITGQFVNLSWGYETWTCFQL